MLKGSIDVVSKGHLVGWLTTESGEAVPQIDCLVDGEFASSAEGFFRQDLKDVGIGDGTGGVRAWVPSSYFDGRVHRVTLVGCAQSHTLGEVSKEVEFPRLLPLNPNAHFAVTHDRLEGWTPSATPFQGFSFMRMIGTGLPQRYTAYTRFTSLPWRGDTSRVGLCQAFELPPRAESRRVLVILGRTPTLTPIVVEASRAEELVVSERVTLGPSWTTYYVALGKAEDVSDLRLWLDASAGVAVVDLAVVAITEWDGKAHALPPPPDAVDDKLLEQSGQLISAQHWSQGATFVAPSPGSQLADGWWFDCTPTQEASFRARLVTSGADLGAANEISTAIAVQHAPLLGSSQISAAIRRGAFLSMPEAQVSVVLSYSSAGELVPPRTTLALFGRAGDARTSLWSRTVDSPLPGRTATLSALVPAADMASLRIQASPFPGLELGVEFRSPYAVTIHQVRVELPQPRDVDQGTGNAFEDSGVEQQSGRLLRELERKSHVSSASVVMDVVVPVFNATEFVEENIRSLIRANDGSYRIVVVDDASGARTRRLLAEFVRAGDISLLHHATNQGYTKSVNDGVREGSAPFVVTLNSDTVVPTGWHRRLLAPFQRFERLGIAGPLSSAGSWQSVPYRFSQTGGWLANSIPLGYDLNDVQEWLTATWQPSYPEIRLLNGFCLCSRRQVFDQIGLFDETSFPIGYGEENDLCLRAAEAGWQLRVVDDLYVYHAKSKSFGKHRTHLSKAGTSRLQEKHPSVDWAEIDAALRHHEGLRAVRAHFGELTGVAE